MTTFIEAARTSKAFDHNEYFTSLH